jgi:hypothetical protein
LNAMAYLMLLCQAAIAVTFAMSTVAKAGRKGFTEFRRSLPNTLRLQPRLANPIAAAVVAGEAATVVMLVMGLWFTGLALAGFMLAAALLTAFTAAVAIMIRRRVTHSCRCFGSSSRPPGRPDLIRNAVLLATAALGGALATLGPSPVMITAGESMSDLPGSIALLYVIGLANLALSTAVLLKFRQQSEWLRQNIEGVTNPEPIMLTAGADEFVATTTDDTVLARADLRGQTLVAFLSPTCPFCAESLPAFVVRAESMPGGRDRVLAVVAGSDTSAAPMRDRLAPVARVVVEPDQGPVARAFGVTGMPAFALLSGTTVVGSHFVLAKVPESVPA